MGFAGAVRLGCYGSGRQVRSGTTLTALTAIGQKIALDTGVDPTKTAGTDKYLPCIQQAIKGWDKEDPHTTKKLPVEADVPELLVKWGTAAGATARDGAIGDLSLVAFYFLLRIGEYTIKQSRNESKQTVQFKMEDITFFQRTPQGQLRQLSRHAPDNDIMGAVGANLKIDNQKNGHKGVCIHHEANGDPMFCPVRALGRRYIHIRQHMTGTWTTPLSACWDDEGCRGDVTDKDVSRSLKLAAQTLDYPTTRGIPIQRVDTHSLRGGGANALSLNGYSDTQIQKMGRWTGDSFKEYIRSELAEFSMGMSRAMKRVIGYTVVSGGAFHELPAELADLAIAA
jgi:hypothetical protein